MRRAALVLALLASPAAAQSFTDSDSGVLRWLDKLTGETADIELMRGQSAVSGRLTIRLDACRYPTDNPTSDAEAHLTITETDIPAPVFDGWMIASSPGLSALDHPRYDVWVLRCVTPEPPPQVEAAPDPNADPATSADDGQ